MSHRLRYMGITTFLSAGETLAWRTPCAEEVVAVTTLAWEEVEGDHWQRLNAMQQLCTERS